MKVALKPNNEHERLQNLYSYEILDTDREVDFDRITALVSKICETEMSLISLVDADRQWFKSSQGIDALETPRDISFCGHAILTDEIFIVENATLDERFRDNPFVIDRPFIRFYAGVPLKTSEGFNVGTLCVIDSKERQLNSLQIEALTTLAQSVETLLSLRKNNYQLRRINNQLIEAQSIAKIGSWSYDLVKDELVWSLEHYKIFDIETSQAPQKLYFKYRSKIHPDDLIELDKLMFKAKNYGEDFIFKHRVVSDSGRVVKYVQGMGHVTVDELGNPIRINGTCRDITFEVESELKISRIVESMDEGLVVQNSSGKIVQYNPAALKILSISEDNITKKDSLDPSWKAIKANRSPFPGNEHPAMIALASGNKVTNVTMGLVLDDNDIRWIKINSIPFNENEERHVVSSFSDITELIKVIEENKFVMEALNIGVWKYNPTTRALVWDESMYKLYEVEPDQFSGDYEAWSKTLDEKDLLKAEQLLQDAIDGSSEFNTEFHIITKDNRQKVIGARAKVVRNYDGKPSMVCGINWDKTEEHKLKIQLEEEGQKAFHISKLASIGEMAAGIGHEINNPLAIIKGEILIIKKNPNISDIGTRLSVVEGSIERITNIVDGLRTFSRMDKKEFEAFDLSRLFNETLKLLKELFMQEGVVICPDIDKNISIIGNRGRIQQVIVNLLNNAKDALEGIDNKQIIVTCKRDGHHVNISISDNGVGIPPEIQSKIFDPFFTTKPINKGTGIGLSIVHSAVSEHHGDINVKSSPGAGTTFSIMLPNVVDDVIVKDRNDLAKRRTNFNITVLFVDDEEGIRDLFQYQLEELGIKVITKPNGLEALSFYNEHSDSIDLIITDNKMPLMNGMELITAIRRSGAKQPKCILTSGAITFDDSTKSTQIDGVLFKPFEEEELVSYLNNFFP